MGCRAHAAAGGGCVRTQNNVHPTRLRGCAQLPLASGLHSCRLLHPPFPGTSHPGLPPPLTRNAASLSPRPSSRVAAGMADSTCGSSCCALAASRCQPGRRQACTSPSAGPELPCPLMFLFASRHVLVMLDDPPPSCVHEVRSIKRTLVAFEAVTLLGLLACEESPHINAGRSMLRLDFKAAGGSTTATTATRHGGRQAPQHLPAAGLAALLCIRVHAWQQHICTVAKR